MAEPVHDLARRRSRNLEAFFAPVSVAVIGTNDHPGNVGGRIFDNLINGAYRGKVFAVDSKYASVRGQPTFPAIGALPQRVDLAIIVTPAATVPDVIAQCAAAGVRGAIIISAGFREAGEEGRALEQRVFDAARATGMRIIGPNCLGVMSPIAGFNGTFAANIARPGNIALLSQSGALGTAILDWSLAQHFGFSRFVSTGSMLDVGWGDLIDYLGDDPQTKSIVIYMESVGDAHAFMSAAREVALAKPIIVIKAGRSEAASKAARSHTGSLTGSDAVFDAALARCGVMRVDTIEELFLMSEALAEQPRPAGNRLAIVTNAGGPGVLAADALAAGGGALAQLSAQTLAALDAVLPPHWSHADPVDVLGDADAHRYGQAFELVAADPANDAVLAIFAPQGITPSTDIAAVLAAQPRTPGKPILASWMGGEGVRAGIDILMQAGIPTFLYPDIAARLFNYMWRYGATLDGLYETPELPRNITVAATALQASDIIANAREARRSLLTEAESKALLAAYGLPVNPTRACASAEGAVAAAKGFGFPVVVKLQSLSVTHKSDIGGVVLDVRDERAVREAYETIRHNTVTLGSREAFAGVSVQPMISAQGYELILGSSVDAEFGPVLLFGLGGTLVEVFKDRALGLPPLTTTLARRMMEHTRIYGALAHGRRSPSEAGLGARRLAELETLLVRFAALVIDQPRIKEIDVNPLLVSQDLMLVLDARIVLHDAAIPDAALPRPVIRPYPNAYAGEWRAADGARFVIRPIRPEDEPLMRTFHETLSETSVYQRWVHVVPLNERVAHGHLIRTCFIDYDRQMALVALPADAKTPAIVAVGRLIKSHGGAEAEFALAVSDAYQGHGIGTELLRRLIDFGRAEGAQRIIGNVLKENGGMRSVCKKLGFAIRYRDDDPMALAVLNL